MRFLIGLILTLLVCGMVSAEGPFLYAGSIFHADVDSITYVECLFIPVMLPEGQDGITKFIDVKEALRKFFDDEPNIKYIRVLDLGKDWLAPGGYSVIARWTIVDTEDNVELWGDGAWSDWNETPLFFTKPTKPASPFSSIRLGL